MAVTKKEVEHIAFLSRLEIKGEEFEALSLDMQNIVEMVDSLLALSTGGGEEELDLRRVNALRADEIAPSLPREKILRNAPSQQAGCISVPRVVE